MGPAILARQPGRAAADTGNQLLLLRGLRRARMPADIRHPFGYGAELFYWSLLAGLGIFLIGGVLAVWQGVQRMLHPVPLEGAIWGLAVLGLGCVLDGTSLLTSARQLRREARAHAVPLRWHLRSTTDTSVTAVFYEDTAALVGDIIAIAGLELHRLLGTALPDAAAGIAIGLLLAIVGLRLAGRNRDLLTNRSESHVVLDRIRALLAASPEIAAVGTVASIYIGPRQLLVIADVQPHDTVSGVRMRQLLAELRNGVRQSIPNASAVFLMPVPVAEKPRELTPLDLEYWLRRYPDREQT